MIALLMASLLTTDNWQIGKHSCNQNHQLSYKSRFKDSCRQNSTTKVKTLVLPVIFSTYLINYGVTGLLEPIPASVEAGKHPRWFTRAMQRPTATQTHIHTYGALLELPINLWSMFFRMWEEAGAPEENSSMNVENMKTPHRKDRN